MKNTAQLVLRLKQLGFDEKTINRQIERWIEQDDQKKTEVRCANCFNKFRVERRGRYRNQYCSPECARHAYYLRQKRQKEALRDQTLSSL